MFDFFFMTYDEPEADKNFEALKKHIPHAKRVHGVEGIARAWVTAAQRAETSHFYTMDGDSRLLTNFNLELQDFQGKDDKRVHVFRARNRVNGLVYGYGSIHCFHTEHVRAFNNLDVVDFTLSVATEGFKIQPALVSETCYNTSPYISFKSGFREASKLASATNAYAGSQVQSNSTGRLKVWTTVGRDEKFGEWVILGARLGALHGFNYKDDPEKLALISNHSWFRELFESYKDKNLSESLQETSRDLETLGFSCPELDSDKSRFVKSLFYNI
jgi:hypothetical protein